MLTTAKPVGITFAVDEVKPATNPLPEVHVHEALRQKLSRLESCHDYHSKIVERRHSHGLLEAVHTAFSEHRPLVLSPDHVWLTISQGVANHMVVLGERLRSRFVSHQGKLDLFFTCEGWVENSPENPWPEAFASWTQQIRDHVGETIHETLICDFNTSGPTERAVSQIVMMDIFKRYFHYRMVGICGIPTVTLEGSTDDWQRLRDKLEGLKIFDMDWWLDHIRPICDQLVRASRGDIDLEHWQSICKLQAAYGGDIINGWVAKLFPYLQAFPGGPCTRQNNIFETGEGFTTLYAPPGMSRVPFTWTNGATGSSRLMEALGGFVGITQDAKTFAVRPKIGWAIREADAYDVLLARVSQDHRTFPGANVSGTNDRGWPKESDYPADLSKFYHTTNGAEFLDGSGNVTLRVHPVEAVQPLDSDENREALGSYGPNGRIWHRFITLADGKSLAINLDRNLHIAPWRKVPELMAKLDHLRHDSLAPICLVNSEREPKLNPIVAFSFLELLERLLDNGGKPYWKEAKFQSDANAEQFTPRI